MSLVFNFDELKTNEKTAPKSLLQIIRRAGSTVASSWVDGKTRRENAISFKQIHLVFADSQEAVLRVKQSGDIYQVRLNGRAIPIKHQDDYKRAIIEVIDAVDANLSKFQKKLAQTKVTLPVGIKSTVTRKEDALKQRLVELDQAIAQAQAELASARFDEALDDEEEEWIDEHDEQDEFDAQAEWDAMAGDDEATMDGDFVGHPFRGNQYKRASRQSGAAVSASQHAKRHAKTGDAKALKVAHRVAHYAHKAAAIGATGQAKKYHNKMARFHGKHGGVN
ncbi:hypothetical protein [Hydromonas duriensis]|uniref:Defence against restriction A N-terminal domain-containing protein n=1 Tax=Hydromonas duriensis TaxID=1527608 RepID=A0A4R6Y2F8_9BURK|nr:hypothetical protein [Hydromonas duriensis]TDR30693.1 hypothetical protein DFR44_11843 [Hydromonas duriensis]